MVRRSSIGTSVTARKSLDRTTASANATPATALIALAPMVYAMVCSKCGRKPRSPPPWKLSTWLSVSRLKNFGAIRLKDKSRYLPSVSAAASQAMVAITMPRAYQRHAPERAFDLQTSSRQVRLAASP